ncbi:hypothetical protein [Kutzneria kofuensis]|uniref:Uncharacterized protein n=1 Tax=Kutzneria kofuensis TaxID=103725 RepID=A0A7W9KF19_9PSEU|nr:hypothetical protein [Kutzneria kofuensis]MBB5890674.1 hypothetical protein [Kutzneria kofuensis]
MSESPPIPEKQEDIEFEIERLTWTNAVYYFVPVRGVKRIYLRTDLRADRAPRTQELCLLGLMEHGCVAEDAPGTQCRLRVAEGGDLTLVPLLVTPLGRRYLRSLFSALANQP